MTQSELKAMSLGDLNSREQEITKAIGSAIAEGNDIGDLAQSLVSMRKTLAERRGEENKDAINSAKHTLVEGISNLIKGSKIEDLLGTQVVRLGFRIYTPEGQSAPVTEVVLNPKSVGRSAGAGTSNRGKKYNVTNPQGQVTEGMTARALADAHANDEEKGHSYFLSWPTNLVANKVIPRLKESGFTVVEAS